MMNLNEVTNAVTDLKHMNGFALDVSECLMGSESDKDIFQMPAAEANRLTFCLFDIQHRLSELLKALEATL